MMISIDLLCSTALMLMDPNTFLSTTVRGSDPIIRTLDAG
jgi:hypothetical protein